MDLVVKKEDMVNAAIDTVISYSNFPKDVAFVGLLKETADEQTIEEAFENRNEKVPEDFIFSDWAEICISEALPIAYYVADMRKCLLNKVTGEIMDKNPYAISMECVQAQDCISIITAKEQHSFLSKIFNTKGVSYEQ